MTDLKLETQRLVAGAEIKIINKAAEAEAILVEGIAGVSVTNGVVKINCFQQFMEPETPGVIVGKLTVTLNIPVPVFLQMDPILRHLADVIVAEAKPPAPQAE